MRAEGSRFFHVPELSDSDNDLLLALSALGRALAKCISDERGAVPPLLAPIVYQCLEGHSVRLSSLIAIPLFGSLRHSLTYSRTVNSPILTGGRSIAHRDACSPSDLSVLLARVADIDPIWKRSISAALFDRDQMQYFTFADVAPEYVPTGIGMCVCVYVTPSLIHID